MPKRKLDRPSYPRINCCIPGCRRGTTTFEPGTTMICGKCWRRAPKRLRDRWSFWRRKAKLLRKKEDGRWEACEDRAYVQFEHIRMLLTGEGEDGGTLPALMAEELRRIGLP